MTVEWTRDMTAALHRLLNQTPRLSLEKVAEQLGVHRSVVMRYCQIHCINTRRRHPRSEAAVAAKIAAR